MSLIDRFFPIHTVAEIEKNLTQRYKTENGLDNAISVNDEKSIMFNKSRKEGRMNKDK
jgi:hypothetical protein